MKKKDSQRAVICANVAQILRCERTARRMSLGQLAGLAGLSRQMVSYVESGARNPSLETLLRLTQALDIELYQVIRTAGESLKHAQ